jgi:adenylate cyclase
LWESPKKTYKPLKKTIISDQTLAQLLNKIKAQNPRVIGLDIYRDLPEAPGHENLIQVFQSTPNLIGVRKVIGYDGFPVAAPPQLAQQNQVGAIDLLPDGDGKVRRYFLYVVNPEGEIVPSFGLQLAQLYLTAEGILPQPSPQNPNHLQLGQAVLIPFDQNDGGYIRADDSSYQGILNYTAPPHTFEQVSLTQVLNDEIPPELMEDQIVLIGHVAQSKKDFHFTPYSSVLIGFPEKMAGVEIHANIINHLIQAALAKQAVIQTLSEPLEWLWILMGSIVGATFSWQWRYQQGFSILSLPATLGTIFTVSLFWICGYLAFLMGWWIPVVPPILAILISVTIINSYLAKKAADIRIIFSRYFSNDVVATLLENPEPLKLGGQRQNVTILMSDLRGFSMISQGLEPEQVVTLLNIYLAKMIDVINQYQGTINEVIGDGILVFFGALIAQENDSQRAIACAIAMQLAMAEVNQQLQRLKLPKIQMGIGINSGEVVVGNIGSQHYAKWTVVGSQINLASRIESQTVGGQIYISENTLKQAGTVVKINTEKKVKPKGFSDPVCIYEVQGIAGNYNLYLPNVENRLVTLQRAIPISCAIIQGKEVSEQQFTGDLIKLSENSAAIDSDFLIEPSTDLQIELRLPFSPMAGHHLYAKVTHVQNVRRFHIQFTGVPPEIASILKTWSRSSKSV